MVMEWWLVSGGLKSLRTGAGLTTADGKLRRWSSHVPRLTKQGRDRVFVFWGFKNEYRSHPKPDGRTQKFFTFCVRFRNNEDFTLEMNLRPQSEPDHAADEINFEAEIRVLHPLL